MNTTVILNGVSKRRVFFYKKILPQLEKVSSVQVRETTFAGHAEQLSVEASSTSAVILAAGGDGTLHQVVNGIYRAGAQGRVSLGLVPLGSGNDFARSIGATPSGEGIANMVRQNQPKLVDVGLAELRDEKGQTIRRHFINVCSLGMGPEVVRSMQTSSRALGPAWNYYQSIIRTFFTLRPRQMEIVSDHFEWSGKARVFAVANGRAFGHAVYIAPDADISDQLLNTFTAGDFPMWRFLLYLQTIKMGRKVSDAGIRYGTGRSFRVNSTESMPVEAEGELIGYTPLHCTLASERLRFLY